jgi:RNA polymerase sigma factor (sigma-70 family)
MQGEKIVRQVLHLKDKLYRFAYRIVENEVDAEDVVQETFVKVWQKSEQLEGIDNKEAWCMTVARNLAIDKIRARKKANSSDIDGFHHLSDDSPTPDIITEDKESLSIVMKTLNKLPEHQRQIIHLRDIDGYTYKEIGEITGYSEEQVKVNLFRARQKLKLELKDFTY